MKKLSSIIIGLALAVSIFSLVNQAKSAPPAQRREVVLLQGDQVGIPTNGQWQYVDIELTVSSSSAGAPKFPNRSVQQASGFPVAEALAQLLSQGYEIQQHDACTYLLVK